MLNDQDFLDDKLATGQHNIRRHSPIPVDPLSGVCTGVSEDEKVSKDELVKSDVKDLQTKGTGCLIHNGHKENKSQRILIESGRKPVWPIIKKMMLCCNKKIQIK